MDLLIALVEGHKPSLMKSTAVTQALLLFGLSAAFLTSQQTQLSIKDTMKNINTKFIFSALCISALSTGLLGMDFGAYGEQQIYRYVVNKNIDRLKDALTQEYIEHKKAGYGDWRLLSNNELMDSIRRAHELQDDIQNVQRAQRDFNRFCGQGYSTGRVFRCVQEDVQNAVKERGGTKRLVIQTLLNAFSAQPSTADNNR
jgi:hypothetical protein